MSFLDGNSISIGPIRIVIGSSMAFSPGDKPEDNRFITSVRIQCPEESASLSKWQDSVERNLQNRPLMREISTQMQNYMRAHDISYKLFNAGASQDISLQPKTRSIEESCEQLNAELTVAVAVIAQRFANKEIIVADAPKHVNQSSIWQQRLRNSIETLLEETMPVLHDKDKADHSFLEEVTHAALQHVAGNPTTLLGKHTTSMEELAKRFAATYHLTADEDFLYDASRFQHRVQDIANEYQAQFGRRTFQTL